MTKVCSIEDCDNETHARGWCEKHYTRWHRTGDPLMVRVPIRKRKESCKHGHPLSGDNVWIRVIGNRTVQVCKTCRNESVYRLRAARREARADR